MLWSLGTNRCILVLVDWHVPIRCTARVQHAVVLVACANSQWLEVLYIYIFVCRWGMSLIPNLGDRHNYFFLSFFFFCSLERARNGSVLSSLNLARCSVLASFDYGPVRKSNQIPQAAIFHKNGGFGSERAPARITRLQRAIVRRRAAKLPWVPAWKAWPVSTPFTTAFNTFKIK